MMLKSTKIPNGIDDSLIDNHFKQVEDSLMNLSRVLSSLYISSLANSSNSSSITVNSQSQAQPQPQQQSSSVTNNFLKGLCIHHHTERFLYPRKIWTKMLWFKRISFSNTLIIFFYLGLMSVMLHVTVYHILFVSFYRKFPI